jgi:hypothetical protein
MCEQCGQNKAAAKVQLGDGQSKLLCKPCVEQEQRQSEQAMAAAAASGGGGGGGGAGAPKIKIGTYKEPKDDKKEKAILERDWGLDKKKDKNLSLPDKIRKLEAQLADIDAAIASEKKKKDGMDQLVGFYAKDPKQQKEVVAEVADLVKVIQTATEHRATIASQLSQCQAGTDPLNASAKRPGGGGASNQPLPSAGGVYRATAKKNAALGKTWGVKVLAATLTDPQKVDALYQQLDELEAAIATEVKGKQGLAVLAEQYRSSNPAQYQQISEEIVGIDDDIKRLEADANRVQADVAVLQSPWKETNAPDGRKYYYHSETGETTWDTPAELKREKRKCEQCDDRARLKVTGADGVARWYCKAHGTAGGVPRLTVPSGGPPSGGPPISPRPRSATAGGPPIGGPPSGGGFAPPPSAGGFAPPPTGGGGFAPPPSMGAPGGFAPPMSPPNVPPPANGFSPPPAAGRPPALTRVVSQPALAVPPAQRGPGAFSPPPGRGPAPGFAPPPSAGGAFASTGGFAPPSGGFAPPPGGGFSGSGGFAPPPASGGGGFAPPPSGGFAPPPGGGGGGGGFAPPPSGGFAPPPGGGGGGFAPPPQPGGGGGGIVAPPGADADPTAIGYAKAHTRFVAEGTGELSLEVGDIVCVLACDGDGWWKCKLRGRKAYCPGSYLQKIPPFQ